MRPYATDPLGTTQIHESPSQCCLKTGTFINIAAGFLVVSGIASVAFSKLQYAAPLAVAGVAGTGIFLASFMSQGNIRDAAAPATTLTALWAGFVGAIMVGAEAAAFTWTPLITFVSTSPTAKLAGPVGAGMITIGVSLWVATSCLWPRNHNFFSPENLNEI